MRDFFEIMRELDIYDVNNHQKTENYYKFHNGSMVEFFATIDDPLSDGNDCLTIETVTFLVRHMYINSCVSEYVLDEREPPRFSMYLYPLLYASKFLENTCVCLISNSLFIAIIVFLFIFY